MVDFAGWSMPVQYTSIVAEHQATRQAAGVFDVSHMGRLRLEGEGAAALLDRLLTRKVVGMGVGKIRYSLVCNDSGGVLDDVLVYHLQHQGSRRYHLLVVNASNRDKIVQWIDSHRHGGEDVDFSDRTLETAMISVQGPAALAIVGMVVGADLSELAYYNGREVTVFGQAAIVSRTGYTGEDGCELIVAAEIAQQVWDKLFAAGQSAGIRAVGLGARDTLRLEAGMPLYGHELNEQINPIQAGLAFAVNFEHREFIGREALMAAKEDKTQPVRVGLSLASRRVPREHYGVLAYKEQIGEVTSGTFSPTLQQPIAMAYVRHEFSTVGAELAVDIRGTAEPAKVVRLPFYTRPTGTP